MKFCSDVYSPQRLNLNDFSDILTFPLVLLSGQNLNLSSTLVYDQIFAKVMTFPSASVVFVFGAN